MARNPFFDPSPASERAAPLGYLRRILTSHLQARSAEPVIPDAELRALHPLLALPRVWAIIQQQMGL